MVKLVASFKRKAGFSVEDFQSHWGTIHGSLAAKLPGLRRYVQNHVIAGAYKNGREPVYDGVAEVWFDNLEDLKNLRNARIQDRTLIASYQQSYDHCTGGK